MKYLSSDPFSSRPASKEYRDNFEETFGPPQISYERWKDLGCICDNHPAAKCQTCRGACGCHFVHVE